MCHNLGKRTESGHTQICVAIRAKHVPASLRQKTLFCFVFYGLNHCVLSCFDSGITAHMGCLLLCVFRDVKGGSWWREEEETKKERWCLWQQGEETGSDASMQLLPNPHSLPVGVCLLCFALLMLGYHVLPPLRERGTCSVTTVLALASSLWWI